VLRNREDYNNFQYYYSMTWGKRDRSLFLGSLNKAVFIQISITAWCLIVLFSCTDYTDVDLAGQYLQSPHIFTSPLSLRIIYIYFLFFPVSSHHLEHLSCQCDFHHKGHKSMIRIIGFDHALPWWAVIHQFIDINPFYLGLYLL
jgi:hypothetical protein